MGDYTLCHLHFLLRKDTPKEVVDIISRGLEGERSDKDPIELSGFSPCSSAYHRIESFAEKESMYSEFYGEYEGLRINTIFQVKYSRGIHEFVDYISPWVTTNEHNRGCIGWTLSEYCSYPTYLFVGAPKEDPKDKYIQELEQKCLELHQKLQLKNAVGNQ